MDFLRKLSARIASQLRTLNLSQQIALLMGGALVAVSVLWLVSWAASPELVPLLDQDLSTEEMARIEAALARLNMQFQAVGGRILVSAGANRAVLMAHLQQDGSLPDDTSVGFAALVKEANPWISQAEHERRWNVALKHELELVLAQFEGVRSASVFLPLGGSQRTFSRNAPEMTASVTLVMEGGQPVARELALAAARQVAGAVRGLPLRNVQVLDANGMSAIDWESENAAMTALDRKRRAEELEVQRKIINQLPDPKALVSARVELEERDQSLHSETPTKPVEVEVETTEETMARISGGGEPGVRPNVGVAASSRTADENTQRSTNKTRLQPAVTVKTEATPAGGVREIWAAVNISYSYLASIWRRSNPEGEPTEADIDAIFEREKSRIVGQVSRLVKPQDDDHVYVSWYHDTFEDLNQPAQAAVLDEAVDIAKRYGPQSALGLLALVSLGLMLRMARRQNGAESFGLEIGLPQEALEAARQAARDAEAAGRRRTARGGKPGGSAERDDGIEAALDAVGQASVSEGVLVAQEVDEKTVQTHKMLNQVSQVIDVDAEATAALLEQWVQRSDAFEA